MQPVAISNRRLVAADDGSVSFRWKDYRIEGPGRWKTMTLTPHEFIRRFLMHVRASTHAKASTQNHQIDRLGLAPPTLTSAPNPHSARCTVGASSPRDFVPWRFSAAGCPSAGMVSQLRRPKTCTTRDSRSAKEYWARFGFRQQRSCIALTRVKFFGDRNRTMGAAITDLVHLSF